MVAQMCCVRSVVRYLYILKIIPWSTLSCYSEKMSIYLMSIYTWLLITLFFSFFTHPPLSLLNLLERSKHQQVLYPTFQIQWIIPWECQSLYIRLENFSTTTLNHWPWFRAVKFHPPTLLFLSYSERKSQCTWIISLTSVSLTKHYHMACEMLINLYWVVYFLLHICTVLPQLPLTYWGCNTMIW